MASRLKRAATSAMRPDPLVITMKFTTSRIAKTMTPIRTSPPIRKPPNAATTWPAASGPSKPCDSTSRVVATLSDRRSSVLISSRVGKLVKSSGRTMNRPTIRISTLAVIDRDRPQSSRKGGSGRTRMVSRAMTPNASPRSLPMRSDLTWIPIRSRTPVAAAIVSAHRDDDGPRNRRAVALVFVQFVTQGADRDSQHGRGLRAVAFAAVQRVQDHVLFDGFDGAAGGGQGGSGNGRRDRAWVER